MKYCPTCETRYEEDILRFCMKDGTPLVEEAEPNFIQMPSEDLNAAAPVEDEIPEEVTVIRRNIPVPPPPPSTIDDDEDFGTPAARPSNERIIVPTYEQQREEQARVRAAQYQAPPPRRANTLLIVILTIIGTVGFLTVAGAAVWFLTRGDNKNANVNANLANANTNLNTNLGIDTNFNFNANFNIAVPNINANANKTPTPTPSATPKPSPSVTPSPTPDDDVIINDNINGRPRVSPTPSPTLRATPTPLPSNRPPVNGGVLNSRAVSLATPSYPQFARNAGASGQVTVQVLFDERGNVISARAVTGHPLLRSAAEQAARHSKFQPTRLGDEPVKTTGVLLYNFRNN